MGRRTRPISSSTKTSISRPTRTTVTPKRRRRYSHKLAALITLSVLSLRTLERAVHYEARP